MKLWGIGPANAMLRELPWHASEMTDFCPESGPPIVVTGMHRSGTSLAASFVAALGVDMGERLLPADAVNPRGYFEDVDFLELDRRLVRSCTPEGEAGHPDWGWTVSERFDRSRLDAGRPAARALIAARAEARRWGWKDPRTTLLLDFWDDLLGDARYVLLYRFPWEVADSLQRLQTDLFLAHPEYAYRIWSFYNRHLLDFHRRHRERSLLVSVDALVGQPAQLEALVEDRFGLKPRSDRGEASLAALLGRGLFHQMGGADPLIGLVAATHTDCVRLLAELDAEADLSSSGLWSVAPVSGARLDGRRTDRLVDVSIVIPCHDDGEPLMFAVASAERNAPEAAELIVVEDGSRQAHTIEILQVLHRAGYHVIDQYDACHAAARNLGIREARGRYLLPLDAYDRLQPDFVQAAVRVLDAEPEVGVVYGGRYELGVRASPVEVPEFDLDGLLQADYSGACPLFRREVWAGCGGFDGKMPTAGWENWDLCLDAAERGWRVHQLAGMNAVKAVTPPQAEVGESLRNYLFAKHRDLYRRRLVTTQHELAAARAVLAEAATELETLRAERDVLAVERRQADAERKRLEGERDDLHADQHRLEGERDRLYAEIASWRRRVAFIEGTRAWRLRKLFLRLRRLGG
jgi:GT2 family glycosyltransferase